LAVEAPRRYILAVARDSRSDPQPDRAPAAKKREANNSMLHLTEMQYLGDQDRLFPQDMPAHKVAAVA
jgi:hypothetical protein